MSDAPSHLYPEATALRQLSPCPFCGHDAERFHMSIMCGVEGGGCGAITCFPICSVASHVERLWNTRAPQPIASAQTEKVPIKESDLARFFLGIVVSERKGIGDVFDSAKDFLAKYEVTVRGSQVSSTGGGAAA